MTQPCDCCAGTERVTPQALENRPGLPALSYRVGVHATFLETMLARLTTVTTPATTDPPPRPLQALSTRAASDPAIAFLDAWATVADVLTFYQERIANEGYLRTATTRRSVLELAKLVGYRLRPGVAASVYLALTVDDGFSGELPIGTRAQSIPASGEQPQFFETSHELIARDEWNAVRPRLTRPQAITVGVGGNAGWIETIYFAGTATKLKADDAILIAWGDAAGAQRFRRVKKVEVEAAENRTRVTLYVSRDGLLDALAYVGQLFDELKRTLPPIAAAAIPQASAVLNPLSLPLKSPPSSAVLADDVERVRHDALAIAAREPQWGIELAAIAALMERVGRAFYPVWPVTGGRQDPLHDFNDVLARILESPAQPPASPEKLETTPQTAFAAHADTLPRLVAGKVWTDVYDAWGQTRVQPPRTLEVYAFRTRAGLYGHNTRAGVPEGFTISLSEVKPNDFTLDDIAIGSSVTLSPPQPIPLHPTPTQDLPLSDGSIVHLTVTAAMVLRLDFERPAFSLVLRSPLAAPGWSAEVVGALTDPVNVKIDYTPPTAATGADIVVSGAFHVDYVPHEAARELSLDAVYPHIVAGGWIAIERPRQAPQPFHVVEVGEGTRADYGVAVRGTRIRLSRGWTRPTDLFDVIRGTTVYAASEELPLAEEPVTEDIAGITIAVDALYGNLDPGRWLIVAGERSDVTTTGGVRSGERVMLAGVLQDVLKTFDPTAKPPGFVELPGDTLHSTFRLATPLSYRYKRDTVTIYANVAEATHGQTVTEVLGNGDARHPLQTFALRQSPLTYLASAATPSGTLSTLMSFVDDVEWKETDSLANLGPADRGYVLDADDADHVTVTFGDGAHGARLPTGSGNVRAQYRYGIGSAGNVAAERISQLASRPPGAKAVLNPLRASGGANRDERDQARRNTPLAVMALDHLVSERDYADFTRAFAGIGKAVAVRLTNGRRQLVHVTIAGIDDVPIDPTSDLYRALVRALRQYGDPYQPLQVDPRALKMLVIGANLRIDPLHQWETVAQAVRAALLGAFGFDRRELGQSAFQSEAISVMQAVAGVDYVELEVFDAIAVDPSTQLQQLVQAAARLRLRTHVEARTARKTATGIAPAELVMLPPDLHDAIMLTEIP